MKKIALFCSILFLLSACAGASAPPAEEQTPFVRQEMQRAESRSVTLMALGDDLLHNTIYRAAQQPDGSYDFHDFFTPIAEDIRSADLAVINQETILVSEHSEVSSYPCFGSPRETATALADLGFDVVQHASNHSFDKGSRGVSETLNIWSDYPQVSVLGIHAGPDEEPLLLERNGIRIGMVNYTYGLNGFVLPKDKPYLIDLLSVPGKLEADLAWCEEQADVSIALLHVGTEYQYQPSAEAKEAVTRAIDAGADVVICAHPHVIGPWGYVVTDAGNAALVYYSLGNCVSGQVEIPCLLGGMAQLTLCKTKYPDGYTETVVSDYTMQPIVTHYRRNESCAVYRLEDYTNELAAQHSIVRDYGKHGFSVEALRALWEKATAW